MSYSNLKHSQDLDYLIYDVWEILPLASLWYTLSFRYKVPSLHSLDWFVESNCVLSLHITVLASEEAEQMATVTTRQSKTSNCPNHCPPRLIS